MGVPRHYISRKYINLATYLVVFGLIYGFYSLLSSSDPKSRDEGFRLVPHVVDRRDIQQQEPEQQQQQQQQQDPFEKYKNGHKKDWLDHAEYARDQSRSGAGEQGKPVLLPDDPAVQQEATALYRANGYNAYVSDMLSLNRSVKDLRHRDCMNMKYSSQLPTVSVIFPFHEEHNSTLLRSVYSIINRSPKELLKEIILVDDASEKPALKQPLEDFLRHEGLSYLVKIIRTKRREGLIRARQIGAEQATAEVLIFLDAHSEANYNWLPPLLDPILDDYKTVVCPMVDVVECDTYEIMPQDQGARGSFDWAFNYKRLPLRKQDRDNPTKPFPSPVMAGGYFAISTKWFWELGGYDEGLDIWGGEQYELSFKVWQCHGRMFDAPCSRVAHIYRCKYQPFKSAGVGDFISRNYKRVAEVWMDEYKENLYKKRGGVGEADTGNLTAQKAIREKLKCKSFDWFMKEIAFDQEKFFPMIEPEPSAKGELRHKSSNKCMDTKFKQANQRFGVNVCNNETDEKGEQELRLTKWHDIRAGKRSICLDVSTSDDQAPVILFDCHSMKGNQLFKYRTDTQQIFHPVSAQCLAAKEDGMGYVFMEQCSPSSARQQWIWQHIDEQLLAERQAAEPLEDKV